MMDLKDLKERIKDLLDEYREERIGNLDSDTEFEIYKAIEYYNGVMNDRLDEMDSEIDAIIEEANEPSQWEQDYREDCRQRTRDLIGG